MLLFEKNTGREKGDREMERKGGRGKKEEPEKGTDTRLKTEDSLVSN